MPRRSYDLYGLHIERTFDVGPWTGPIPDLLWIDRQCDAVSPQQTTVALTPEADGVWTRHFFQYRARCTFAVSPDGRRVISQREPGVHPDDLFALFAEPVMRTVLTRQSLVSFHGAALARDGTAILLIGESGAGKSTLAGALMRDGWTLLTDDLARLRWSDDKWWVTPGFRQLKLHAQTARALDLDPAALRPRWTVFGRGDAGGVQSLGVEDAKFVLQDPAPAQEVPLCAIHMLGRRADRVRIEALPPAEQLRGLIHHLTADPAAPGATPASALTRSIPSILQQASCRRATMTDNATAAIRVAPSLNWIGA